MNVICEATDEFVPLQILVSVSALENFLFNAVINDNVITSDIVVCNILLLVY